MDALIGYTGYVGSYLATKLKNADLYNSKNIGDIVGKKYDNIYFAGLPATKWLVNLNPENDLKNMLDIQYLLSTCEIKRFILISTIDVYDKNKPEQDEDSHYYTDESYGKHRRIMEQWVIDNYNYNILRLPALFGIGLKKNALYDILTNNITCKINLFDKYQWYYLDDLMDDIKFVITNDIKCINLFSEPILMKTILNELFVNEIFPSHDKLTLYDYKSKYFNMYKNDQKYILIKMNEFIKLWRMIYKLDDKLVVSNLCWNDDQMALALLNRYSIKHVELAITRYCGFYDNDTEIMKIKDIFKEFNIYSLQSLFYNLDYNVFVDNKQFRDHFIRLGEICELLNVKRMVFGSPKNRLIPDNMTNDEVIDIFVNTFQVISSLLPDGIIVCIEHNASEYGCNFLTTIQSVIDIVTLINRDNIKMNLDTGNAMMMNDIINFNEIYDHVGHIQISAPNLGNINGMKTLNIGSNYSGKISLEMKLSDDLESNIKTFIMNIK